MARVFDLAVAADEISKNLARSFQSANVNFLVGSGASWPAIPSAGNVEKEIATLFDAGNEDAAYQKLYDFLATIQTPTNSLIAGVANAENATTVKNYSDCLGIIESMLAERRTSLLPKQATIFTTNYDLFIEQASIAESPTRLHIFIRNLFAFLPRETPTLSRNIREFCFWTSMGNTSLQNAYRSQKRSTSFPHVMIYVTSSQ